MDHKIGVSHGSIMKTKSGGVLMKIQTVFEVKGMKPPAEFIKECLQCTSNDLFSFNGDVFCNPCGWNSIELRVESQLDAHISRFKNDQSTLLVFPDYLANASETFHDKEEVTSSVGVA